MAGYLCTTCGLTFQNDAAFRKHRTGDYGKAIYKRRRDGSSTGQVIGYTKHTRVCLPVAQMVALGMVQKETGFWGTGETAFSPKQQEEEEIAQEMALEDEDIAA